jgi:uncharacterized protein (DUF2267 family)
MRSEEFLSHVAERTGLSGLGEAERTVRTVLGVLRERLTWPVLQALAEDLPASLSTSLLSGGPHQDFDLAELHARVARGEGVRPGIAVEHTGVVCQVVAEALSPATLHRLREALPEPIGALFRPREPVKPFEHVHLDPSHHTLAEGRPGSQRPLAEARPERAQTESVVRADNPHGDTKLSSATGLTQEREQETLASGHVGSNRPLSEGGV